MKKILGFCVTTLIFFSSVQSWSEPLQIRPEDNFGIDTRMPVPPPKPIDFLISQVEALQSILWKLTENSSEPISAFDRKKLTEAACDRAKEMNLLLSKKNPELVHLQILTMKDYVKQLKIDSSGHSTKNMELITKSYRSRWKQQINDDIQFLSGEIRKLELMMQAQRTKSNSPDNAAKKASEIFENTKAQDRKIIGMLSELSGACSTLKNRSPKDGMQRVANALSWIQGYQIGNEDSDDDSEASSHHKSSSSSAPGASSNHSK